MIIHGIGRQDVIISENDVVSIDVGVEIDSNAVSVLGGNTSKESDSLSFLKSSVSFIVITFLLIYPIVPQKQ